MLLRVRVTLPDRPGALGQVARTLGVAGADIVQVVVLERLGGRAVDDFTVVWPGASRVERLMAGLAAIPGVQVDGVWKAIGAPVSGGHDAELLAQVAGNPADGLAILVDAVPGLLAADWAAAAVVPADWAARSGGAPRPLPDEPTLHLGSEPATAYASWRAPSPLRLPVVARVDDDDLPAAAFHVIEVDRVAQLVRAAAVILGDRLDHAVAPPVVIEHS
jgi:hypothetical protein